MMTSREIKRELEKRKLSLAAIGRRMRPTVNGVSVGRVVRKVPGSQSARIQRAVARAIGRDVTEVFGDAA